MILAGTVQVAARRTGDWQLSNVDRPVADRIVAVVFVDLTGDEPGFYVVPAGWLREYVKQHYAESHPAGKARPVNPQSRHSTVQLERIKRWDREWRSYASVPTGQ